MLASRVIRVVVIDDHPIVLGGLRESLRGHGDITVVGEAQSLEEARRVLATAVPDVVLVDIRLSDGSGLDLLGERQDGGGAWIVLSSFDTPRYVAASVEMGADGFLLKTAPLDDVVEAIRRVAAGGTAFEARHLQAVRQLRRVRLTRRERQVVERLVAGRSNDEIGADLGLSRKTVEAHLTRLYQRFGVTSRTELAVLAERESWHLSLVGTSSVS